MRYPIWNAGLRFWDLRRYGRNHRKLLVVDEEVAFLGGYNIGSAYATEWRDTHVRINGPGGWDLKRAFADFWNLNRRRRLTRRERPLLIVVPKEGRTIKREALVAHLRGKVASWWLPEELAVVDELPHTATGKLDKVRLRAQFAARSAG